jgi:DNA processing protein
LETVLKYEKTESDEITEKVESSDWVAETSAPYSSPDDIESALRLKLVPGIGPKTYSDLVTHFGSPAQVLEAAPALLREVPGVGAKIVSAIIAAPGDDSVATQLQICRDHDIQILSSSSSQYPRILDEIYDPPSVLFCAGEITAADEIAVAIVGTRHATQYGKKVAEQLARGLAMAGITIVSGLARGIDAVAHRAALDAGGRTLAVLGGGILNVYPAEHAGLADAIKKSGAVLSEALPNVAPKSGCFPRRNRIVSGLSLGVVVVEAGDRSGASISARMAMEQGREVFAVPGRIDSRMSTGCHKLLKDGAKLVQSVDDILDELGPLVVPTKIDSETTIHHPAELKLSQQEKKVLNAISTEPTSFDVVVSEVDLPPARVLSTITVLEMRRLIRRITGTTFVRV